MDEYSVTKIDTYVVEQLLAEGEAHVFLCPECGYATNELPLVERDVFINSNGEVLATVKHDEPYGICPVCGGEIYPTDKVLLRVEDGKVVVVDE